MGLTNSSIGKKASGEELIIRKKSDSDRVIALAGNPNVGKSTVFNGLTGMNQHTGNWPGKTVSNAQGYCKSKDNSYVLVDIPGTYSLMAHSAEEEVARNFICFGGVDAVAVVCDATCLERNINLVLQIAELCPSVVLCLNLMDEARKKGIRIDSAELSRRLGAPVVEIVARKKKSLSLLLDGIDSVIAQKNAERECYKIKYAEAIEKAILSIEERITEIEAFDFPVNKRWLSLRLLENDATFVSEIRSRYGEPLDACLDVAREQRELLADIGISTEILKDEVARSVVAEGERICEGIISYEKSSYRELDKRLDRIFTGRVSAYPVMLALLALIFWITISGANYLSELLSKGLFFVQDLLDTAFISLGAPDWLRGALVFGVYRVLAWVISVMLPPMAIFFPLFTILEDLGYLPRVAYNLDSPLKKCNACGKQALTMCMGFGCNAAGVVGCRIIDSPRERLLAILTNSFIPCNGRFPMLISLIAMFFVGAAGTIGSSFLSALALLCVIVVGVLASLCVTRILSNTLLRGVPSSFTLELPSYRRPQFAKIFVRSIFDRTVFVLGRAASVAAPAGLIIWLMANVSFGGESLLAICSDFLDPLGRFMGLDGAILLAFILGFPANEIVIPIVTMIYTSSGSVGELESIQEMKELFVANGWSWITAGSMILFTLFHWPCSTTLMTVKKETGSLKWTLIAMLVPTVLGVLVCILFANIARIILV